jgi:hypothetical protein
MMVPMPQSTGSDDDRPSCTPSPEAADAIAQARHARLTTEAALPAAEQLRDRVRTVLAANHFTELLEQTLREAALRRMGRAT